MTATIQYGPFSLPLLSSVLARCGLKPGQQVDEKQMRNAVYLNKMLLADETKKEVLEAQKQP